MTFQTPHEFARCPLLNSPFASHSPAEGWSITDGPEDIRSSVEYTLIFVVDRVNSKVLLGLKRRGMGVDLYNGFGGKVEKLESVHDCAARELEEESGLTVKHDGLYYKGCLFSSRPKPEEEALIIKIHFFACIAWTGQPIPTEEMIPEWFDIPTDNSPNHVKLPLDQMWPEASFYLLPVLQSILNDDRDEIFLSRINYQYLKQGDAPTLLPALDGVTVRKSQSYPEEEGQEDIAERLSSWWMCFASNEAVQNISL